MYLLGHTLVCGVSLNTEALGGPPLLLSPPRPLGLCPHSCPSPEGTSGGGTWEGVLGVKVGLSPRRGG